MTDEDRKARKREYMREYYKVNRDKCIDYRHEYYKANREKCIEYQC